MLCRCLKQKREGLGYLLIALLCHSSLHAQPLAARINGRYKHEAPIKATLEVRREGDQYVVALFVAHRLVRARPHQQIAR
jgi:hypothetical protein